MSLAEFHFLIGPYGDGVADYVFIIFYGW